MNSDSNQSASSGGFGASVPSGAAPVDSVPGQGTPTDGAPPGEPGATPTPKPIFMNPAFRQIAQLPENDVFAIVFYPDRIYHAQYLNAARSPRYRYNVQEVRQKLDISFLKGEVYLDGKFYCNFLRVEYRASRLVEVVRQKGRFLRETILADVKLNLPAPGASVETNVTLHRCPFINAYQAEIWQTLEPPAGKAHDFKVLDDMGHNGSITRVRAFSPVLADLQALQRVEISFREDTTDEPFGYKINDPQWDNDYATAYQAPNNPTPNSYKDTTVEVDKYLVDFRRGWFFENAREQVQPVRYSNGMVQEGVGNPDFVPDMGNVIEMRWILQRELGSSLVYFHEVTIPPGCVEGTHRHIGSEELYYIYEGEGIAYMGDGDDPHNDMYPLKTVDIFCIGKRDIRELPVKCGSVIYTKSGGIHGIRNHGTVPLRFVAFGYHSA